MRGMAQLLSPVCAEALKFQNPLLSMCSISSCRTVAKIRTTWTVDGGGGGGKRRGSGRLRVATEGSASTEAIAEDYYAVLGLVTF